MLVSALKRVNALAGTKGKLYNDNTGWFVVWDMNCPFDEHSRSKTALLAYLHGIEDAWSLFNRK